MKLAPLALGALGIGVAVGAVAWVSRRSSTTNGLGRGRTRSARDAVVETRKGGGRTLTHYRRGRLPIKERLGIMQDLVAKSVKDPGMRRLALQITKNCPARDDACELKAIHEWTKANVRYTGDVGAHALWRGGPVESVDLFQSAPVTVENEGGDCDDHSVVNASLAVLNGFQARLRATSPYRWGKDNFTHVYAVVGTPKNDPTRWIALDTTLPDGHAGDEVPFVKKFEVPA